MKMTADDKASRKAAAISQKNCKKSRDQIGLLSQWLNAALKKGELQTDQVIEACDRLGKRLDERYLPFLEQLHRGNSHKAKEQLQEAKIMLGRPWLEEKVKRELGEWSGEEEKTVKAMDYMGREISVKQKRMPLGVLFHIGAGNMEGLPVYSVIEGLLTGNINVVKTAEGDGGLTAAILDLLIEEEPALADYIYVFDVSSQDTDSLKKLGLTADGIVVWGGSEAIGAVRKLAPSNTRIIEWGHKASFCYVTEHALREIRKSAAPELVKELSDLAGHICVTNQLYCNSCQGIYLDTQDKTELLEFGRFFLELLEKAHKREVQRRPSWIENDPMVKGRITCQLRCMELERDKKVLRGNGCSVTLYRDNRLESSLMYRNCWVKMLPHGQILERLKEYKTYLHTAGLVCLEEERKDMAKCLIKAGLVQVVSCGTMGLHWTGEPHDGEFPLMRYCRIATF